MTAPQRIQRSRAKGWRMPPGAVYVGRPTRWGNPHDWTNAAPAGYGGREHAVRLYRIHLANHPELAAAAREHLVGRDLACWCPPSEACHADILLEIANAAAAR